MPIDRKCGIRENWETSLSRGDVREGATAWYFTSIHSKVCSIGRVTSGVCPTFSKVNFHQVKSRFFKILTQPPKNNKTQNDTYEIKWTLMKTHTQHNLVWWCIVRKKIVAAFKESNCQEYCILSVSKMALAGAFVLLISLQRCKSCCHAASICKQIFQKDSSKRKCLCKCQANTQQSKFFRSLALHYECATFHINFSLWQ